MSTDPAELRRRILALVDEYYAAAFPPVPFEPGRSAVPVSGRVFDASDLRQQACLHALDLIGGKVRNAGQLC